MAKIFEVRGRFTAHYATGSEKGAFMANNNVLPEELTDATSGIFDSKVIDLYPSGTSVPAVQWQGAGNWPLTDNISIRIRIVPTWTGNPSVGLTLFRTGLAGTANPGPSGLYWYLDSGSSQGGINIEDADGNTVLNLFGANADFGFNFTDGVPTDLMLTYSSAGALRISQDGVEKFTASGSAYTAADNVGIFGFYRVGGTTNNHEFKLNNLEIWNSVEAHVYTARTAFDATPVRQPLNSTFPATTDVADGVTWTERGVEKTGTKDVVTNLISVGKGKLGSGSLTGVLTNV